MTLSISGVIARNSAAAPADVRALKQALNRLGLYIPDAAVGMNDFADGNMFQALANFQQLVGLSVSGQISPGDATWETLSSQLALVSGNSSYIWMSLDDDRVRPSHRERHKKIFQWNVYPQPGEEPGCRCWAINLPGRSAAPASSFQHDRPCFQEPWLHIATEGVERFERNITFPYADEKGVLTTGLGTNINRRSVFLGVPWRYSSEAGRPASEAEKREAYEKLGSFVAMEMRRAKTAGRAITFTARFYQSLTSLRLPREDAVRMMERDVASFLSELASKFAGFGCFPGPAKAALMDMIYNIGGTKFSAAKWPSLFTAVAARDWERAAGESGRLDVGEERNAYTSDLFKQAAAMERRAAALPSP